MGVNGQKIQIVELVELRLLRLVGISDGLAESTWESMWHPAGPTAAFWCSMTTHEFLGGLCGASERCERALLRRQLLVLYMTMFGPINIAVILVQLVNMCQSKKIAL